MSDLVKSNESMKYHETIVQGAGVETPTTLLASIRDILIRNQEIEFAHKQQSAEREERMINTLENLVTTMNKLMLSMRSVPSSPAPNQATRGSSGKLEFWYGSSKVVSGYHLYAALACHVLESVSGKIRADDKSWTNTSPLEFATMYSLLRAVLSMDSKVGNTQGKIVPPKPSETKFTTLGLLICATSSGRIQVLEGSHIKELADRHSHALDCVAVAFQRITMCPGVVSRENARVLKSVSTPLVIGDTFGYRSTDSNEPDRIYRDVAVLNVNERNNYMKYILEEGKSPPVALKLVQRRTS